MHLPVGRPPCSQAAAGGLLQPHQGLLHARHDEAPVAAAPEPLPDQHAPVVGPGGVALAREPAVEAHVGRVEPDRVVHGRLDGEGRHGPRRRQVRRVYEEQVRQEGQQGEVRRPRRLGRQGGRVHAHEALHAEARGVQAGGGGVGLADLPVARQDAPLERVPPEVEHVPGVPALDEAGLGAVGVDVLRVAVAEPGHGLVVAQLRRRCGGGGGDILGRSLLEPDEGGEVHDGAALDGAHQPRREGPPVGEALDVVRDLLVGVPRQQEGGLQRVHVVGVRDRLLRGGHALAQEVAAKDGARLFARRLEGAV